MQSEPHATHSESSYVCQHLRSVIIHSLDTFNYNNAEFACERLLALDDDNMDSMYLYCLTLFHQGKYKTCYSLLVGLLNTSHLGYGFLYAKCCLKLKKFKEGIYQLVKLNYLYNESSFGQAQGYNDNTNSPFSFASSQQKYNYEHKRSVYPDSSIIYHVLADLYKANGDIKNSALNYVQALKFNQFDFEALQELCKLGVNVKVKSIYKPNHLKSNSVLHPSNDDILPSASHSYDFNDNISNPFSNSVPGGAPTPHGNQVIPAQFETPLIHSDDTFNHAISTPRIRTTVVPDAPLRKSNPNSTNTNGAPPNHFEFTKPNFPIESTDKKHKKESTYSKITSRLISQPGVSGGASGNTGPNTSNPGGNSNTSKLLETPGSKKGIRSNLKRNSSSGLIPTMNQNNNDQESHTSMAKLKEIEKSEAYLLKLYTVFAKSFKCMCKYDCYKAIRLLEESLSEKDKETPWVLSKLGRLHYEIVNYKQSEYFFSRLRKLDRTRLEDMEYYSTLLWHLHRKIELTYLANELHDLDPNSAITWCVIGNLFSLTREQDEAIKCFDKATKIDENFTYAYTLKGHEYFGNDNYEMALENFRISLLIDSRHYNALYGIGMVYINLGDYQKADYHFRKAVSINPINIILICCVGMVLEKLGKKNLALRQYELANKLQPLNPLPIFKKAQSLFAMQQFPQALKYFETLKELAPDEASVHFLLGQLYNIQNDKFSAIKEFTIAMNLDPKGNYLIREAMESLKTDS